jgi:hypothetical protein
MSTNPRDQEDADWALAAQQGKRKGRIRPFFFTLIVMAATFLAGFPVGMLVLTDSPEKFGALWYRVTMISGGIAFFLFEWLAMKERRLLRQKPDFWGQRHF